jgi:hypothetical protein
MISALLDSVTNPDIAQAFTILRTTVAFGVGGLLANTPQNIQAYGIVTVAQDIYLEMIPEADRVHGARMFITSTTIYETSEQRGVISDILLYGGQRWRVQSIGPYGNRGFNYAVATRMRGA